VEYTKGNGQWSITAGQGGIFSDVTSANSIFYGIPGEAYMLNWTVANNCGSSNDQVNIHFYLCQPQPSLADAGNDQLNITNSSVVLAANVPSFGTGQWSLVNGTGGSFSDMNSSTSTFSGMEGQTYELQWTITNSCNSSSDNIFVSFLLCTPQPSTANAGIDQIGLLVDTTNLAASNPAFGTGQWTILGGSGGSFSDATSSSSTFYGAPGELYTLDWTVTTTCGSTSDQVTISFYLCLPDPSISYAGIDQLNILEDSTLLDANFPLIGNGLWTVLSGTGGTFSDATSANSIFYGTPGETYELEWEVSNNCGATSDLVQIHFFLCTPQPSLADAGTDQLYVAFNSVTLAANVPMVGTGEWSVSSGPGGSFSDINLANSIFYGAPGEMYNLVWTISSTCGSTSDDLVIGFQICSPQPSTANAGGDQLNILVDSVILAASNPTSGNGLWTIQTGTSGTFSDATSPSSTFYGIQGDSYVLDWTVTTPCGSTSDQVNIGFYLCSQTPSLADAGSNQLNLLIDSTYLAAAVPTTGTGQWEIISGQGGSLADASSPTSLFHGVLGESYELEWTVSNNCGSSSDIIDVSFYLCLPQPTVADAGFDQLNIQINSVTLAANNPTSGIGQWSVEGTGGFFSDPTLANSTFTGIPGQSYHLGWTISNACGSSLTRKICP